MTQMERERALYAYHRALSEGDFETLARIHQMSETDPTLARQIAELEEAEAALIPELALQEDARQVRALLDEHLSQGPDPAEEPQPVTVAEVAGRLRAERRVPHADQAALRQLEGREVPLPAQLGLRQLRALLKDLGASASVAFLRLFQETAVLLGLGQSQRAGLAAARRKERSQAQAQVPAPPKKEEEPQS